MRNYTPVPVCCVLPEASCGEHRLRPLTRAESEKGSAAPSPISLATLGYSLRAGLGYDGDRQLP